MPIDYAQWLIAHQVLFSRAYEDVSRVEMIEHNRIIVDYLDDSDEIVHLILDDSAMGLVEPQFSEVQKLLTFQSHPQLGWLIHISNNRVIRHFSNLMARIARMKYRQFIIQEEALAYLQQQEPQLAWDTLELLVMQPESF